MWILTIALVLVLGFAMDLLFQIHNRNIMKLHRQLPGPQPLPIIGNAHLFRGNSQNILKAVCKLMAAYSTPFRIWFSYKFYTVICRPEDIEIVLNKALEKDSMYKLSTPWTGLGLFTAPVSKWRHNRRIIQPTFNTRILESFIEVFVHQSEVLTRILQRHVGRGPFDAYQYISPCTLDIICETAMGFKIGAQTGENQTYVKTAIRLLDIHFQRMIKIWLHPDFFFNLSEYAKEHEEGITYMHNLTDSVIKRKREEYRSKVEELKQDIQEPKLPKRKAFLDYLIELADVSANWTNQELRQEVDTMMIAGNDTTANVNSFVLLMLGMHQSIQDRVYEEINSIFGESTRPCTAEDLKKMTYLEMVIKETMRLFPPGALILRQITQDLPLGKCTLPAGTGCVVGIMHTHRLPDIWPNPQVFDPDRFIPEECAKRHPYAFVPFSGGPRNCIGGRYAYMSMKCVLSTVLRKYHVFTDVTMDTMPLKLEIFLKPVDGFPIRIEERWKSQAAHINI